MFAPLILSSLVGTTVGSGVWFSDTSEGGKLLEIRRFVEGRFGTADPRGGVLETPFLALPDLRVICRDSNRSRVPSLALQVPPLASRVGDGFLELPTCDSPIFGFPTASSVASNLRVSPFIHSPPQPSRCLAGISQTDLTTRESAPSLRPSKQGSASQSDCAGVAVGTERLLCCRVVLHSIFERQNNRLYPIPSPLAVQHRPDKSHVAIPNCGGEARAFGGGKRVEIGIDWGHSPNADSRTSSTSRR